MTFYSLIGRMDPSRSLAVALDVGTNNEKLLNDPLYVVSIFSSQRNHPTNPCWKRQGWSEKRVRGEAYDKFIDK